MEDLRLDQWQGIIYMIIEGKCVLNGSNIEHFPISYDTKFSFYAQTIDKFILDVHMQRFNGDHNDRRK